MVEPGTHGQDVTHGGRSDTPDTTPDEVPFLRVVCMQLLVIVSSYYVLSSVVFTETWRGHCSAW